MVYPNLNWVHIKSFDLWNKCGAYANIRDVDPPSHMYHELDLIGLSMNLMVKIYFHHIWVV
jgi:hypothetical protein